MFEWLTYFTMSSCSKDYMFEIHHEFLNDSLTIIPKKDGPWESLILDHLLQSDFNLSRKVVDGKCEYYPEDNSFRIYIK